MKFYKITLGLLGLVSGSKISTSKLLETASQSPSTGPTCKPPSDSQNVITWGTCGLDPNTWYGTTRSGLTVLQAESTCTKFGGQLISIPDETTDICAYYALTKDPLLKTGELVLYSGHYFPVFQQWAWCPNYFFGRYTDQMCDGLMNQYNNWKGGANQGNCMAGSLSDNLSSFYDYGWTSISCNEVDQVRLQALCRLPCDSVPEPYTTWPVTEPDTIRPTTQPSYSTTTTETRTYPPTYATTRPYLQGLKWYKNLTTFLDKIFSKA